MGDSLLFHCRNCGYEKHLFLGIGMLFPEDYKETVKDIQDGKYGLKWKSLFNSLPQVKVNADREVYVCPSCGTWKEEYNLSLYVPRHPIGKDDEVPTDKSAYIVPWELSRDWTLYRSYIHLCPDCYKRMHLGRDSDKPSCPKCKGIGEFQPGKILWD